MRQEGLEHGAEICNKCLKPGPEQGAPASDRYPLNTSGPYLVDGTVGAGPHRRCRPRCLEGSRRANQHNSWAGYRRNRDGSAGHRFIMRAPRGLSPSTAHGRGSFDTQCDSTQRRMRKSERKRARHLPGARALWQTASSARRVGAVDALRAGTARP